MRIEQLEYFQAVAKSRSMNLASEQLHLTPQALSMAIKALAGAERHAVKPQLQWHYADQGRGLCLPVSR